MSRKYGTFAGDLLEAIGEATGFFSWPPEGSSGWIAKQLKRKKFVYDTLHRLKKEGLVKQISKNGKHFIELTKKGELETLLIKAHTNLSAPTEWDGKWRQVIFDIPEDTKDKRDKLRRLLKKHGFYGLQASVFVSPHPLNREAIAYLKETGLIDYIRIGRLEELDDDKDLKKRFKLL
ncbi:MAG: CRISPR-associated endonuclease Cas2 [Patescibacteria group bacterium]